MDIEDIEVMITIKDIDDGDDLEESAEIDTLKDGKKETVSLDFEIPLEVDEDVYDVIIEVDGEDENNTNHEAEWNIQLEINKDKHDIIVHDATLSKTSVECGKSVMFDAEIINIGSSDEDDISVRITNSDLDLDYEKSDIELEEGTDDNKYELSTTIDVGSKVEAGTYPIQIEALRGGTTEDTETIDLTVKSCDTTGSASETMAVETVILPRTTYIEPITQTKTTSVSFRDSGMYLTLLIIATVIILGLVIYAAGAVIILSKK